MAYPITTKKKNTHTQNKNFPQKKKKKKGWLIKPIF